MDLALSRTLATARMRPVNQNVSTYVGNSDPVPLLTARIELLKVAVALVAHGESLNQDLHGVIDELTADPTGPAVTYSEDSAKLEAGIVGVFQSGDRFGLEIRYSGATEARARRFARAWLSHTGRIEFVKLLAREGDS
jgi:hypothetical protein